MSIKAESFHNDKPEQPKTITEFSYLGDCVSSFDEDGSSLIDGLYDVSDFACVEEESEHISRKMFTRYINNPQILDGFEDVLKDKKSEFYYHKDRNILLMYDGNIDIHYIFLGKEIPTPENYVKPKQKKINLYLGFR